MSGNSGFIVPYTITEWNRVRTLFRSDDVEELEECLSILAMWRSRMGDAVPVAITCSDLLIRVAIEERKCKNDTTGQKMEALKMLHCITIIRFINYVNEINQPEHRSISIVASVKLIGIPRWLVEIRHNAAHSHVPPICTLRRAFDFSFKWIWDNFWMRPADEAIRTAGLMAAGLDESNDLALLNEQRIQNVIADYIKWKSSYGAKAANPTVRDVQLSKIRAMILHEPYDFLRAFVSHGMLILTPEQLNVAGITDVVEDWEVPQWLQNFWEPVFACISENRLLGELIICLLSANLPIDSTGEQQATGWAKIILKSVVPIDVDILTSMEWNRILQKMVASTGRFRAKLVEAVMLRVPNMTDKRRGQVRRIMDISTMEAPSVEDSMTVRTVEDLQKLIKKDSRRAAVTSPAGQILFKPCDPEEWAGLPIGLAPGQHYDSLSLIIDDHWLETREAQERNRTNAALPKVMEED